MAFVKETEAVPRRVYSSSSARCFDHIFDHGLCNNGLFPVVLNKKALNLSDLPLPTEDANSGCRIDASENAAAKGKYVGEYVRRLVPPNLVNVSIAVDKELDEFHHLQPFLNSVKNRPDVVLLKGGLPLLIVEVQSSPFRHSLSKTVVGLIDQLRLLRNYNRDINQCTGFTFPEYEGKECVAQVCVEWKDFLFHVDYTPLTTAQAVQTTVSCTIAESLDFNIPRGVECDRFFIALSSPELQLVSDCVHEPILCQFPSRQSIVLQGEFHFWKYVPNDYERVNLWSYFDGRQTLRRCKVNHLDFFGVEKYERPLSRQEAKLCLCSLVEGVIEVLEYHHDTEKVAHLDVRLENICFQSNNAVVMIDFDRHMPADKRASFSETYDSVMYQANVGWKCTNLDWKQLGLMIVWVISDSLHNYHRANFMDVTDAFLRGLLFQGKCDHSKFPGLLSQHNTKTLANVLDHRRANSS